ncbi:MAG: co-chaperone GroES [Chloroflexi bacterium]|nr:co-chaperone GroES [Chloroflexota bacterium]
MTTKSKVTKSKVSFKPLGNRIVIEPSEDDEQMSSGGIYIPDTAKEKPQEGKVVAAGPGRMTDDGNRIPMELAVGDVVVYSKYAGTEYKEGETEYLVLREDDILFKK